MLGEGLFLFENLQLIQVSAHARQLGLDSLLGVYACHLNLLVGRIVHDIFQHVILLLKHRRGVVSLHREILDVYIDTLHIHLDGHAVFIERYRYVPETFQADNVLVNKPYLLGSVLCEEVHLAYLHYKILTRFLV